MKMKIWLRVKDPRESVKATLYRKIESTEITNGTERSLLWVFHGEIIQIDRYVPIDQEEQDFDWYEKIGEGRYIWSKTANNPDKNLKYFYETDAWWRFNRIKNKA